MRRAWAAAVFLVGTICWAGAPQGPEVFAAPLTARIDPDSIPNSARGYAQLLSARGGVESFFIVVRAEQGAKIEVRAQALKAGEAELSSDRIRISQVLFADSDQGPLADIVAPLPTGGLRARAGKNVPLLVEVSVPRDAAAGVYDGALEVSLDGKPQRTVPLRVKVLKATIPATSSLPSAFGFDGRGAWMLHGGDEEARRVTAQKYARSALSHRITLVGGSGLAPGQTGVTPGEGWLELDFTGFDRELSPLMEGVAELGGAKQTAVAVRTPPHLSSMERFKYVLSVRKHLREKGWTRALVLVDGVPAFPRDDGKVAQVVVECDGVYACRKASEVQKPWWRLTVKGEPGEPSLALGADPTKIRGIGWAAFHMNVAGLRLEDASDGFTDTAAGGSLGASALFYPPRMGGASNQEPVESVRLKLLRDGLQDYELLVLADGARLQRARQFYGENVKGVSDDARMDALREILDGEDPQVREQAAVLPTVR